jgi:hypothetical protein
MSDEDGDSDGEKNFCLNSPFTITNTFFIQ